MVTGNPLSYRGKTLTWQNGRELATVDGTKTYTYGADGLRTAKTVLESGDGSFVPIEPFPF